MNWVFKLSILKIALLLFLFTGCKQDYSTPPAQIEYYYSLPDSIVETSQILEELIGASDARIRAWASLAQSEKFILQTNFIAALPHIENAEYLFRELDDKLGLSKVMHYKAHAYWSLGANAKNVIAFSEAAIALAPPDKWSMYSGNHTIYLLDRGYYKEVLSLSDTLLPIFRKEESSGQILPSEAYAVRAVAIQGLQGDAQEVDTLINAALGQINFLNPVDRLHVYRLALYLGALSQQQLAVCVDFAQKIKSADLEAEAREQLDQIDLLGETSDQSRRALMSAYKRASRDSELLKEELVSYELERGKRASLREEKAAAFKQTTFLATSLSIIAALLAFVLIYRNQNVASQARINEQDAVLLLESYKNRIRPHFLFNQLNNVNSFLNQEKLEEAQEYVGLLSVHLRLLLESSNEKLSTISQEYDRLKNYVILQQKANNDKVEVRYSTDQESPQVRIPTGILQPLVENSFKYAGNMKFSDVYIHVSAQVIENKVNINIEDSGYGFMERAPGTGQGLRLIEERIAFYKSISPHPELWTLSTDFGKRKSTVNITMPLTYTS